MTEEIQQKLSDHIASLPVAQENGHQWRMSKAGSCQRSIEYSIIEGPPPQGSSVDYLSSLRFMVGHSLHTMWQDIVKGAFGEDFHSMETEINIPIRLPDGEELVISGHPDGVIESLDSIYELKNISEASFSKIRERDEPSQEHYVQANGYAHALGKQNIIFHYFNKNSHESLFFFKPYMRDLWDSTANKLMTAYLNGKAGVIGPRPFNDMSSFPCSYCAYKLKCFEGFTEEVMTMKAVTLDDMDVIAWAERINSARLTRLTSEKVEAEFKVKLSNYLLNQNISEAKAGERYISIKVGKNNNPIVTIK